MAFASKKPPFAHAYRTVMTNVRLVLALRPQCLPVRRHRSLDPFRSPDLCRTSTLALLHHASAPLRANHSPSRPNAKSATAHGLFARLHDRLQRPNARCNQSFLPDCRIRCRNRCVDCCRILVLLLHIG